MGTYLFTSPYDDTEIVFRWIFHRELLSCVVLASLYKTYLDFALDNCNFVLVFRTGRIFLHLI